MTTPLHAGSPEIARLLHWAGLGGDPCTELSLRLSRAKTAWCLVVSAKIFEASGSGALVLKHVTVNLTEAEAAKLASAFGVKANFYTLEVTMPNGCFASVESRGELSKLGPLKDLKFGPYSRRALVQGAN